MMHSVAIVRSQASAMFAPAPAATPFTAAIIGFLIEQILLMFGCKSLTMTLKLGHLAL